MNASQLLRLVAEHGQAARDELTEELATLDARRIQIIQLMGAVDDILLPAQQMTPKPGVLEPEP